MTKRTRDAVAAKRDHFRPAGGVRVLHKTLDILEQLKQARSGSRLADLSRLVEMPKPTVHRILATLEGRGYLDRAPDGAYRVAKKFFDMRRDEPIEQLVLRAAETLIEKLGALCKETVNLGILDAGEVVVIHTLESPQAVRMSSKVGNRRLLHSTALGKVMLAGLPDRDVLRLIKMKGLPRLTATTLVTKQAVLGEIQRVREQGFALDNQENEAEGRCLGAPILGPDHAVVAALSISGPVFRMDLARAHSLVGTLQNTCAAISRAVSGAGIPACRFSR
jgi:DNA-binding IclR family transcriptional regulator